MKFIEKNLRFWGHNCFSIESNKSVLVTDPWFSNSGAFFGSWFQYPKNHHLKDHFLNLLNLKENVFIFISHEHQDHYDINFLKDLPAKAKIIIPKYLDPSFRDAISNLGYEVTELDDSIEKKIDKEISIKLYISDIGINHDSAIMIKKDSFTFLNQNDCKIFDRLSEITDDIDYYSVQFSGATWHPSCFEFSDRRKEYISKQKVDNKYRNVLNGIKRLNPKYFIPAAGPAIFPFLEPSLSYGKGNIFVHQDNLHQYLALNGFHKTIFLRPGDYFNNELTEPILAPNEDELEEYKKDIVDVWGSLSDELDINSLSESINKRLNEIQEIEIENCPILIFNFSEKFDDKNFSSSDKIFIDLNNKSILTEFDYKNDYEEIIASRKYFNLMISEGWQNVYLTMRAKVIRRPDIFNNDLNIFIFSDIGNIRDNYLKTRDIPKDRIEVKNRNGEVFEINRFCPHQGADLCDAKITDDNILICPRHGWEFDLNNKGINKASAETIESRKK